MEILFPANEGGGIWGQDSLYTTNKQREVRLFSEDDHFSPSSLYMFSFHRASGLRLKLITTHIRGISFLQLYTGIAFALSRVLMPDAFPITLISGAF